MKRRWLVCSVVVLSLVLALPASTQTKSVLTNGGFEVDTSGWVAQGMGNSLTRVTTPVHSGAGAAQLTIGYLTPGEGYQCIDLSPHLPTWPADGGTKYLTFNGYLYADGTNNVNLSYNFWSNTDCSGTPLGYSSSSPTTAASWQLHTLTAAIPAGAQSVSVQFGTGFDSTMYADDLAVFSSTATAVQTRGMAARSGLWAAGLVGAAAVGVVLGRRKESKNHESRIKNHES